ncbi:hypothetical protein [Ralstonia pseudosolanacearum]|uniref:hypothetical protein n=1 Tax=Ralstonia pseudosolanacearum TaxID=1310165 RepID=UPI003CF9A898
MAPRKTTRKPAPAPSDVVVTEAVALELLQRNPYTMHTYTLVAQKLGCSTTRSLELLDVLAKRGAIQQGVNVVGMTVFQAQIDGHTPHLQRIVGRGELRGDYNGSYRHWELAMAARRS